MSSDRKFDIGVLLYGDRFKKLTVTIASMEPYLALSFPVAWARAVVEAMEYLDGEANTPLWFWRP